MKNMIKLFVLTALLGWMVSCESTEPINNDELVDQAGNQFGYADGTVTVPFKTNLSVWDHSDYTDTRCGLPPVFYLTMIGDGNINHLGKMTTQMNFCVNVSTGYYYNTVGSFVAANGDELFFEIPSGQIFLNEKDNKDYYKTRFDDPIYFTGGTGRFEGATGEATTNAFVHNGTDEWRTDFFSKGYIKLPKENNGNHSLSFGD